MSINISKFSYHHRHFPHTSFTSLLARGHLSGWDWAQGPVLALLTTLLQGRLALSPISQMGILRLRAVAWLRSSNELYVSLRGRGLPGLYLTCLIVKHAISQYEESVSEVSSRSTLVKTGPRYSMFSYLNSAKRQSSVPRRTRVTGVQFRKLL